MNTMRKKVKQQLKRGTIVEGKWHKNRYKIIRLLGSGTVGSVYLCSKNGQLFALKMSEQSLSMTAEVQVLKMLKTNKVQGSRLGPYLFDVDDWDIGNGDVVSFYVMEYINGMSIQSFVHRNGTVWIGVLLIQLLDQLEQLHEIGYVFGDLKSENIIVTNHPPTIRLIDVGGTTKIGRSVKEYTNFYDRAYWRLGKRIAEPSYDLFSVVMVLLSIYYPKKFTRAAGVTDYYTLIKQKLLHIKPFRPYAPILLNALKGKYKNVSQMRNHLFTQIIDSEKRNDKHSHVSIWVELLLITSCASVYFAIYYLMVHI